MASGIGTEVMTQVPAGSLGVIQRAIGSGDEIVRGLVAISGGNTTGEGLSDPEQAVGGQECHVQQVSTDDAELQPHLRDHGPTDVSDKEGQHRADIRAKDRLRVPIPIRSPSALRRRISSAIATNNSG